MNEPVGSVVAYKHFNGKHSYYLILPTDLVLSGDESLKHMDWAPGKTWSRSAQGDFCWIGSDVELVV